MSPPRKAQALQVSQPGSPESLRPSCGRSCMHSTACALWLAAKLPAAPELELAADSGQASASQALYPPES